MSIGIELVEAWVWLLWIIFHNSFEFLVLGHIALSEKAQWLVVSSA